MTQKINPISFRLGLLQVWNTIFSSYGNKHKFIYVHLKLQLKMYIKRIFDHYGLILDSYEMYINNKSTVLFIKCNEVSKKPIPFYSIKTSIVNFNYEITKKPITIFIFKKPLFLNSANLVINYLFYSVNTGITVKESLKSIYSMLLNQISNKKIFITTEGPHQFYLQGMKIRLKGRFENTRNPMSKTLDLKKGSPSLPNLETYTEYSQLCLYTKSGILNICIWLLYKKI